MLLADHPPPDDSGLDSTFASVPRLPRADRGLGHTLRNIASDLHALFRNEVALVRAQISERISGFAVKAAGAAAGAVLALVGLIVFVLGIAAAIALWLPVWAALLLTGVAMIAIGGLIAWLTVTRLAKPIEACLAAADDATLVAAATA